ncbi:hypothetical protein GCM10010278_84880 [Streptomyces melanogenes]|nr:hypothetical protein GCM10010278_84880 [Streptomyces melanogenes]
MCATVGAGTDNDGLGKMARRGPEAPSGGGKEGRPGWQWLAQWSERPGELALPPSGCGVGVGAGRRAGSSRRTSAVR